MFPYIAGRHGDVGKRGKGGEKLVMVNPENYKVLLGQFN